MSAADAAPYEMLARSIERELELIGDAIFEEGYAAAVPRAIDRLGELLDEAGA